MDAAPQTTPIRRGLRVRGVVQGVGFRPAVHRLAHSLSLGGFVRNDSGGVWIEIEGEPSQVARFERELAPAIPLAARVDSIESAELSPAWEREFRIVASPNPHKESTGSAMNSAMVPADRAPCDDCLGELKNPHDRRYRYPFINCTACGPRFSIVRALPYDRAQTTLDQFTLCALCKAEYQDPTNRRFHAEPNACPDCGPSLRWTDSQGVASGDAALVRAIAMLQSGRIVAVKGVGGYGLALDATDELAVAGLRVRKQRPDKPFALLVRDIAEARRLVKLTLKDELLLQSPERPIVLAPALPGSPVAASVAPRLCELGVMLPPSPLHYLLVQHGPKILVLTSGNRSEEPIAKDELSSRNALAEIADGFLDHDREIHTRVDDSVVRITLGSPRVLRRARGLVPDMISLGFESPSVLAVGAQQKSTVCVTRKDGAFLSQHIGALDSPETFAFFEETIAKLTELVGVTPCCIAHDLHPDYSSTRWARGAQLPLLGVQHHHAHIASCLAEHGRHDPVIGVAFDGTGCAPGGPSTGALWGGEFLLADLAGFTRAGHLRPIALAGGEAAIRAPWRLAVAALLDAGIASDGIIDIEPSRQGGIAQLLARPALSPRATGAGRWFDALSAIVGVRKEVSYEGQAAIELEACATVVGDCRYDFALEPGAPFSIDLRPLVRGVANDRSRGVPNRYIAAAIYEAFARLIVEGCVHLREQTRRNVVALSGGCFQSALLLESTVTKLEALGFDVLAHKRAPPNDGGISLGQAAVAAWRLRTKESV